MKRLILVALLLTVAGCSQTGGTSAPATAASSSAPAASAAAPSDSASTAPASSAPASSASAEGTAVTVKDFKIDPVDIKAPAGTVTLAVSNAGPTVHNVAIRDASGKVLATTKDLKAGESETITAELAAGSYTTFCSLPGHESLGTKGTLEVGS